MNHIIQQHHLNDSKTTKPHKERVNTSQNYSGIYTKKNAYLTHWIFENKRKGRNKEVEVVGHDKGLFL